MYALTSLPKCRIGHPTLPDTTRHGRIQREVGDRLTLGLGRRAVRQAPQTAVHQILHHFFCLARLLDAGDPGTLQRPGRALTVLFLEPIDNEFRPAVVAN